MATRPEGHISRLRVAVLLGGPSAEREISLASGAAVSRALAAAGHSVVEIDPAAMDLAVYDWRGIDAAFIALHGRFGEDGTVQQLLGDAGIPYTGSGATASRIAFSKSASKERFLQQSVPTPDYVLIHESDTAHRILEGARHLGFPLVVKPDAQGSSLGVSITAGPGELPAALAGVFRYGSFGLLEAAIDGSEWTVALLDDQTLPAIHIETPRAFFDFHAKYAAPETRYRFDYDIAAQDVQRIEEVARSACRALATRGLARVDVMLDRRGRPWVLEVNTVPGLTDHSLAPKAAARSGISFGDLCERCLRSALAHAAAVRGTRRRSA